jgi:hypothetical protein
MKELHRLQRRERQWLAPETYMRLQHGARRIAVNTSQAVQAMGELALTVEYPRRWRHRPHRDRGRVIDFNARRFENQLGPEELYRKARGELPPHQWVEVRSKERRRVAARYGREVIFTADDQGLSFAAWLPGS